MNKGKESDSGHYITDTLQKQSSLLYLLLDWVLKISSLKELNASRTFQHICGHMFPRSWLEISDRMYGRNRWNISLLVNYTSLDCNFASTENKSITTSNIWFYEDMILYLTSTSTLMLLEINILLYSKILFKITSLQQSKILFKITSSNYKRYSIKYSFTLSCSYIKI